MLGLLRNFIEQQQMIEFIKLLYESMVKAEDRRLFVATLRDTRMQGTLLPGDVMRSSDTSKWSIEPSEGGTEEKPDQ